MNHRWPGAENATKRQKDAVERAMGYIAEDGDTPGRPKLNSDLNVRVLQLDSGEIVRTWIAKPDGSLTWTS